MAAFMRMTFAILLIAAFVSPLVFAGDPAPPVCAPGELAGVTGCTPSRHDVSEARHIFNRGLKLQSQGELYQAFNAFEYAAKLVPAHPEYATAREITRQTLVLRHLERGNYYLADQRQVEALAEFRNALELDPGNQFAQQRLRDAVGDTAPPTSIALQLVEESEETELRPRDGRRDFRFRGDTRGLVEEVARQFGVSVIFDASVTPRPVRFNVDGADFATAMALANRLGKTFWVPLSDTSIFVAADNAENRRAFERMSVRTYYIHGAQGVPDMNQMAGVLRTLFELRFVSLHPERSLVQVRGPKPMLDAAARFFEQTSILKPQVMLDIRAYELDRTFLRDLGVDLPLQWRMFNIPSSALLLAQNPNIQDLINRLIASGGINQATSGDIAALLAQLQNQNSLFSNPVVTFGGGLTLTGIAVPPASVRLRFNESQVRTLQHMTLRAGDGSVATFRVGSRYPILNATFSPIFNTPDLSRVIQNRSFIAPFPSFTYEDLGITVKAQPRVHRSGDVTLNLETQVKGLGGQALNGVPVLTNREYKGTVTLKSGESAMVMGSISAEESDALRGIPGVAYIPGLNLLTGTKSKQKRESEILLVVTPYVVAPHQGSDSEVWLPAP